MCQPQWAASQKHSSSLARLAFGVFAQFWGSRAAYTCSADSEEEIAL